jgi:site-specific DNA recombinase
MIPSSTSMCSSGRENCGPSEAATSARASNSSDYLLTGQLICQKCGARFVGSQSNGRGGNYRYYICGTRSKHDKNACDAETMRADDLERAIVEQVVDVYADLDLFEGATSSALDADPAALGQVDGELGVVERENRKVEGTIGRYLAAFEAGTMSDEDCGARLRELRSQKVELEASRAALEEQRLAMITTPAPRRELEAMGVEVRAIIDAGDPRLVKRLLDAVIERIEVLPDQRVRPQFRIPLSAPSPGKGRTPVRVPTNQVELRGIEPLTPSMPWIISVLVRAR